MKKQLINLNPVKEQVKEKLIEKYNETLFMNTTKIELKLDIEDMLEEYIEQQNIVEPTIYITPNAYIKMRMLVDKSDKEIGWYGIVNEMPGLQATYIIEDIVVYPQKVTGVTVEQDEDRMFEFEMSLTTEQVNHKRFHGHSHVNMGTSPSGVDESFYQDLLSQVTDYFIITITNKRNEYTTRFYDVANNILYTDVPIQLIQDDGSLYLDWYETNKEQVKEHTYTTTQVTKPTLPANKSKTKTPTKTKQKQTSIFDYEDDYWDDYFWDPNLYDYITPEAYKDIYGTKYKGEFDDCYQNRYRKSKCNKNR
jgi:hypothetical protein